MQADDRWQRDEEQPEAARIAGCCDEAIARCEHGLGDATAQSACLLPVDNHTLAAEPSFIEASVIDVFLLIISPLFRCQFLL